MATRITLTYRYLLYNRKNKISYCKSCIVVVYFSVLINCNHHISVMEIAEDLQARVRYGTGESGTGDSGTGESGTGVPGSQVPVLGSQVPGSQVPYRGARYRGFRYRGVLLFMPFSQCYGFKYSEFRSIYRILAQSWIRFQGYVVNL